MWKSYLKELFETGSAKRPLREAYETDYSDTPEMRRLRKSLTTETLWFWILKLLSKRPRHAYVLRHDIKDEFSFMPGNVTCYKVLYFLKRGGYVITKNEGRKKIYYITHKGKNELRKAKEFLEKTSSEV
jgi:DNA-binding PadR family transcriptional regulator